MATIHEMTAEYLNLRAKKKAAERVLKDRLQPVNARMTEIENLFLKYMQEQGTTSAPNAAGTPYQTTRTSVKVEDWPRTLEFIRDNELWHMLYRNVSKESVEGWLEEYGELPPGLAVSRTIAINVKGAKK